MALLKVEVCEVQQIMHFILVKKNKKSYKRLITSYIISQKY
jgi:hypothetical protein